ncbi:MAG: hypothetical protein ACQGVK_02640 [Myxococcota bacterium]
MDAVLFIGQLAAMLAMFVVGLRLIALHARTRARPELYIGTSFLLTGAIPTAVDQALQHGIGAEPAVSNLLYLLLVCTGSSLLYQFTRVVFRPTSRRAALLTHGVALVYVVCLVGHAATGGFAEMTDGGAFYSVGLAFRCGGFAWSSFEALRYQRLLARRLRLGLADPLLVNRFALWSVAAAAASVCYGSWIIELIRGGGVFPEPIAAMMLLQTACGLLAAGTIWLAFFPPRAYQARLARTAVASDS